MHPSPRFRETDPAVLLARMAAHPLALVAVNGDTAPLVSHTPVIARQDEDGIVLRFHLSAANPAAARLLAGAPRHRGPGPQQSPPPGVAPALGGWAARLTNNQGCQPPCR
jgi:hypothetical protein